MNSNNNITIETNEGRVVEIELKYVIEDAKGTVNITDAMLQGGSIGTQWVGHPSEIKWAVDG